jgi:hypothetical protein
MAELELRCPEDFKKLIGWTIKDAEVNLSVPGHPAVSLTISHPAASKPVELVISPNVSIVVRDNIISVNPDMSFRTRDVEQEKQTD